MNEFIVGFVVGCILGAMFGACLGLFFYSLAVISHDATMLDG